ncbi:hypothetical protein L2449_09580 [Mesorhizobium muleiense]|uniref:hypothetical protein n=1 Tax=Mesorhizobium muleiense TaxID=1004279 RepID=UPI001F360430|nr:hypothetical protein [Mesorhizobium muleiense]MCF6117163.1 hypothetical protein [Mesorhizobium muleiense]
MVEKAESDSLTESEESMTALKQRNANPGALYVDPDAPAGRLHSLGGSKSDVWNNVIANQAMQALWLKNSTAEDRNNQLTATVAALMGIAPNDELEGMLAAQAIAAHAAAMECYRRAMIGEQTFEGRKENLSQANKLSRTYATILEALNRHRGKGQQKVTVEHVHVHAGGQALVGTVNAASKEGGGATNTIEDQPHAKIADAFEPSVRCENEVGEPVQITSNAKR